MRGAVLQRSGLFRRAERTGEAYTGQPRLKVQGNKIYASGANGELKHPLKVFVIEDNVVLRELLVQALGDIPQVDIVFFADNEISATNWLSSNDGAWDLAVVDLHLKQGSGVAALSWCTTRRPDQRVVVLSGELSDKVRKQCMALGADAVFDKATEMNDFLDYCRALAAE
jgi:DNA-binding NarL/FixJ family response regulator